MFYTKEEMRKIRIKKFFYWLLVFGAVAVATFVLMFLLIRF